MAKHVFALLVLLAVVSYASATNWYGTWSANNRHGGVMYTCVKGDQLYGVYSNGGVIIGTVRGDTAEGIWFEGGRGNRNDYQGSFKITLSSDGQLFDGIFFRVSEEGLVHRWHEVRLGAPHPSQPSDTQCLVPYAKQITGTFYGGPALDLTPGEYKICVDSDIRTGQAYGSFSSPTGFLEGWHFDSATGYHGYRYTNDGLSGAYILRATSETELRGFFWRGRLSASNIGTSRAEVLTRRSDDATRSECEKVGPGFLLRLRGPSSAASTVSASIAILVAAVAVFLGLAL